MWEKVGFGVDISCDIIMSSKDIKWISHPYACICLCYIWLHLNWKYFMVLFLLFLLSLYILSCRKKLAFPEFWLNLYTLVNCLMAVHCSCFTFSHSWGDLTISLSKDSQCSCTEDRPHTAQWNYWKALPLYREAVLGWSFCWIHWRKMMFLKLNWYLINHWVEIVKSEHETTANYSIY